VASACAPTNSKPVVLWSKAASFIPFTSVHPLVEWHREHVDPNAPSWMSSWQEAQVSNASPVYCT